MTAASGGTDGRPVGGTPLMDQDDNAQAAGMSQANFLAEQNDG